MLLYFANNSLDFVNIWKTYLHHQLLLLLIVVKRDDANVRFKDLVVKKPLFWLILHGKYLNNPSCFVWRSIILIFATAVHLHVVNNISKIYLATLITGVTSPISKNNPEIMFFWRKCTFFLNLSERVRCGLQHNFLLQM